jgi:small subunit ribosomal protein S1
MAEERQDHPQPNLPTEDPQPEPANGAEAGAPAPPDAAEETPAPETPTGPRALTVDHILNLDDEDQREKDELTEMLSLYEESMKNLEEGEILKGRILRVDEEEVVVDIGFKSEGVISLEEFSDSDAIKVGDEIDVFLEKMENQDGLVVLSKQRADFLKVWDRVREAADKGEVVEGRLVRKIKGGAVVDLFGVEAFLPGSQIALRPPHAVEELMDQTLQFKIIKLNKRRRNIVVSRRLVLEEERASAKEEILSELEVGQIRSGYVKNITDFGAFIDLGGIDGLLHITDISWGRIRHPSEIVQVGDKLQVKVLSFEPERERISLGLKQLTEYPWDRVDEKYPVGTKVKGRVVSITEYGAFVELEKGVEGLIHVSEMSWTKHIRHPNKILTEGQDVECMVLKVDKENEKISLGLKQVEPDPWLTLDERFPIGITVEGKVRNLTNFGAFVELEDGIDGLVHISDLSWTRRVNHPSEILKKGQDVQVKVLNIDKENRRISLGLKQAGEDPWPRLVEKYPVNADVKGKVLKLMDRGVIVIVDDEVEGFIPITQLGLEEVKNAADHFAEGDELELKVTRIDLANHRMVLSLKAWLAEQDEEVAKSFLEKHGKGKQISTEPGEEEESEPSRGESKPEEDAGEAARDERPESAQPGADGAGGSEAVAGAAGAEAEAEPGSGTSGEEPQAAAEGSETEKS